MARVPSAAGIVAGAAVVAVCVLLFMAAEALPVFIIGLLIAYVLDPVVTWLAGHRVPRGLGTLIAIGGLALILGALATLFLDTVISQAAAFAATLPEAFDQLEAWIAGSGLSDRAKEDLLALVASIESAVANVDATVVLQPILNGLIAVLGSFFTLLVLPFFLFFVLAGRPKLARDLHDVLPDQWRTDVLTVITIGLGSFGTYIRAEAIVATILGTLVFVSLMAMSVLVDPAFAEVALLLAIIAFFSEFIPNFGPWIAAIPAVLFALTISPEAVVATVLLYLVVMFLEGQVLVPKIEGGAFSFHPALVLFLVVAGVTLMGILGAIIALPVTAAAWRGSRYAFRRAGGQPPGLATALGGEPEADARSLMPAEEATGRPGAVTPEA
ncbi:MAG TPA: AI-2E family transporter [Candidatus Limnocylindrales bacterium]|nr:AI-2E family transporter [Candidatus Limnocylindrales bacterium]